MGTKVTSSVPYFGADAHLYQPGEIFELADGVKLSGTMAVVGVEVEAKKAGRPKKSGPETFSEIAKQDADKVA